MSKTELELANEWLLGDDTGSSSKALCAHMLGIELTCPSPPWDAADRGRCIRLLNKIPAWWDRLDEMKAYAPHESLVISSSGLEIETEGWAEQVELIRKEAELTQKPAEETEGQDGKNN